MRSLKQKTVELMTPKAGIHLTLCYGVYALGNAERKSWEKAAMKLIIVLENFFWGKSKYCLGLNKKKINQVEFQLTFCGNAKIKTLNRNYRGKDKVTDILSFPVHDSLRKGVMNIPLIGPQLLLGDLIICVDKAIKQAKSFNITLEQELIHLIIHGILHLCGFDHEESKREEIIMLKLEDKWVKEVYRQLY